MSMDYVAGNGEDGREEGEEEGRRREGQWLLVANRNADHYQSLEDLRSVSQVFVNLGAFCS